jgi:hypothetical protein
MRHPHQRFTFLTLSLIFTLRFNSPIPHFSVHFYCISTPWPTYQLSSFQLFGLKPLLLQKLSFPLVKAILTSVLLLSGPWLIMSGILATAIFYHRPIPSCQMPGCTFCYTLYRLPCAVGAGYTILLQMVVSDQPVGRNHQQSFCLKGTIFSTLYGCLHGLSVKNNTAPIFFLETKRIIGFLVRRRTSLLVHLG